jgi:hypothetical protein
LSLDRPVNSSAFGARVAGFQISGDSNGFIFLVSAQFQARSSEILPLSWPKLKLKWLLRQLAEALAS